MGKNSPRKSKYKKEIIKNSNCFKKCNLSSLSTFNIMLTVLCVL